MRINNNKGKIARPAGDKKVQKFPDKNNSELSKNTASRIKKGIVIDISDHARKIQAQNERILDSTLSKEISSERLAEINTRIDNKYYDNEKVIRKMVDNMFDNAVLIRT